MAVTAVRIRLSGIPGDRAAAAAGGLGSLVRRDFVAGAALTLLSLAGCSTNNDPSSAAAERIGNLQAPLRGVASAVSGRVVIVDKGDGITLTLVASNLLQGNYRLAFHENPKCDTRIGTTAGPVWGPTNSPKLPGELIPIAYVGQAGVVNLSVHISGVHIDGEPSVRNHSVVLHRGEFVDSPLPGLPNNYIACGVFGDLQPSILDDFAK